jgi:acylphosphatase
MPRTAVRLQIQGRVQGVGFRWWTVRQAQALGVTGWVRNRRDGSVEVLAIGEPKALEALIDACGRGPAGAEVRSLTQSPAEDDGSAGFEERATF